MLGGGGARGAAHIGVLKVLERERIPIHAIAGTSVGAIIGGLYASGHSPEEIERFVTSIDWVDIFRDTTARADLPMRQKETDLGILANLEIGIDDKKLTYPTTLVRGQKLGLLLRKEFLGRSQLQSFDELPIPFRCVATDIGNVRPRGVRCGRSRARDPQQHGGAGRVRAGAAPGQTTRRRRHRRQPADRRGARRWASTGSSWSMSARRSSRPRTSTRHSRCCCRW